LAEQHSENENSESQKLTFTSLIKQLEPNCWKPDHVFKALLETVYIALRAEMKRRGLLNMPPVWLGDKYENWDSWKDPEAFEVLCIDCYVFSIIDPYDKLHAALKISDNIDGLIFLNIKYFVSNLQKKNDPVGHAVAQHAKQATQRAIEKGIFTPTGLNNKEEVDNQTLLTVSSSNPSTTSEKEQILEILYNNSTNPTWKDIRLKLAGKDKTVQGPLCEIICQLTKSGISCFRFKALADAMKEDVRALKEKDMAARKNMALEIEDWGVEQIELEKGDIQNILVPIVEADTAYEEYESFVEFVEQIRKAIDRLKYQQRVKERLHQEFTEIADAIERKDEILSQAELGRRLDISKATVSGDMKILGKLIQQIKLNDLE